MRILSREDLTTLIENRGDPAISIYMPTQRAGDTEQNLIRFKNSLAEAERQLDDYGYRPADTRSFLKPLAELLNDSPFWNHQADGLAVFLSPEVFRHYRVPHSLEELVVVGLRFHIKPLMPLFAEDGIFYVLALSQKKARLLQCTRYYAWDVTPEDIPSGMAETLQYDDPEKQLQFRTTGPTGDAMFHGHGLGKDDSKDSILRYFQEIDRVLGEVLRAEHSPLVLAAVDYLHPIYREANKCNRLLDDGIQGNPDDLSEQELQEKAWAIVQPHFESGRTSMMEQYHEAASKGLATGDTKQAVLAAYDGRVSALFVPAGVQQWGRFDPEGRKLHLYEEAKPGLEDLLDLAAVHTLTKGGTVYAVEPEQVPGETSIAAILRY